MPAVPAVCSSCGLVFDSPFFLQNVTDATFAGNTVTCPRCRAQADVVDGVYEALGDTLKVLITTEGSTTKLDALLHALQLAQKQNASPEQVKRTINQLTPELKVLADAVPQTPLGLNEYLKTLCLLITTAIAIYTFFRATPQQVSQEEINKKIETEVGKALQQQSRTLPARRSAAPTPRPKPKTSAGPNRHQRRVQAKKFRHK
jgi:hypothetical protein